MPSWKYVQRKLYILSSTQVPLRQKTFCFHITGLRENTISNIVRGTKTAINFEHLEKIANALSVSDIREIMNFQKQ